MLRRLLVLSFALLFLGPALAAYADEVADPVDQQGLWARLQSGGYIVLLRHAVTEPGVDDPPNFTLGDCSTQRNLSEQGRADAARIGQAFRNHGVAVDAVLSSRWCRCIDTARLAFGRVTPTPYLDSMFGEEEGVLRKRPAPPSLHWAPHRARGTWSWSRMRRTSRRSPGCRQARAKWWW
jgi:hypothetical protein